MRITQVATQGRQDYDQWVTRYTISSSEDGTHWAMYRDKSQDKVTIIDFPYCSVGSATPLRSELKINVYSVL